MAYISTLHILFYARPAVRNASSSKVWHPPPAGIVKPNADASVSSEGLVGLGVVARNHEGKVLFAATRRMHAYWAPEVAEAKALSMVARLGRRYGLRDVILETDCQTLTKKLEKGNVFLSDLDSIIGDIFSLCTAFDSIIWSHVKREGNFVAHHLAKLIPFGVEQVWENFCPQEITPNVLMDNLVS
ncbi:uncharacterized protein LOC110720726 [Chenopodium quinoa]|uniref:uncharacterized protein LOC110720726 n=1 Tax=Chenopodium quinoa TaxID=63459 RepID=UPI000B779647|nr:uncharacterized protein LOC110720726 [Chenopodium quinoa]